MLGRLATSSVISRSRTRTMATAAGSRRFYGCCVYVSEAQSAALLRQLEGVAARAPGAALANLFVDRPYNRTNFTLVGSSVPCLASAAVVLARAALAALDLRQHAATHPRLGTVDHISCHPLPLEAAAADALPATEQQQQQQAAAALALAIARELGSGPHALPVLTYGLAHPQRRRLDEVRRKLDYFKGAGAGSWKGGLQPAAGSPMQAADDLPLALPLTPCFGPAVAAPRTGVCCVGAGGWIVNYNVLLLTRDMAAARGVARAVSERGGGLPGVQAMALLHTGGIEVACNLLEPGTTPPEAVLQAVGRLAAQRGLALGPAYRTNKSPGELVAAALALEGAGGG